MRQVSCTRPVSKKVAHTIRKISEVTSVGSIQSNPNQSFASPAPKELLLHANKRKKLASQMSVSPGKCKITPPIIRGIVNQFGILRVYQSYKLINRSEMSNQIIGCSSYDLQIAGL
jgi:hypothetical protein